MGKAKLLVVDDETYTRKFLKELLEGEGYDVTTVEDGKKAIEAVKSNGYKVIFLDIIMPGMNGIETFAALKEIGEKATVIMITAYEVSSQILEALKMGAFVCLRKPFVINEVIAATERALRQGE